MTTIWGLPANEQSPPLIFANPVLVPSVAALAALPVVALINNVQQVDTSAFYTGGKAGGGSYVAQPTDTTSGALFSGSIAGSTLNVASVTNGSLLPGYAIRNNGVLDRTFIIAQLSGVAGGIGTYSVTNNQAVNQGPMTADDGASVIVSLSGMRWALKYSQSITASQFGVVFDFNTGTLTGTDNWGPYQALWWFNVRTNIPVKLDEGNFGILGKINVNGVNVTGLNIKGVGKFATNLYQMHATDPVHQLNATNLSHSWDVGSFSTRYTTAGNHVTAPDRAFIRCPSAGATDFFNSKFDEIFCDGADYFIKSTGPSIWGHKRDGIALGGGMTGGMSYTVPDHSTGQPNNNERGCYLDCHNMVGPIWQGSGTEQSLHNTEMNAGLLGPRFIDDGAGGIWNGSFNRMEVATYNTANQILIAVANGALNFDIWEIATLTVTQPIYCFSFIGNPLNSNKVDYVITSFAAITGAGAFYLNVGLVVSPANVTVGLTIGDWYSNLPIDGVLVAVANNGSTSGASGINILSWNDPARIQYIPDADFQILGPGPLHYIYNVANAANRLVTPPNPFGNNVFDGMRRRVTKHDKTGAGTVTFLGKVIPAASEGTIEGVCSRANGFTWRVTEFATWT